MGKKKAIEKKEDKQQDIITSLLKFYKEIPAAYKAVVAGLFFEMIRRQITKRKEIQNKPDQRLDQLSKELQEQKQMLQKQNSLIEQILKKIS